eukprot:GILJ01009340.1.p1 GENE.GILJ01009340.1~~GILJ01009340.1.p1  ORF type:complete len:299 (+),score=33.48 GILJ01009340.1:41-898(+)
MKKHNFVAGSVAGAISTTIVQPFDVIRTRIQGQNALSPYKGVIHAAQLVAKNEGIVALWNGLGASMLRTGFGAGCYFTLLSWMQGYVDKNSGLHNFATGAFARVLVTSVTCPLTVVKTRFESTLRNEYGGVFNALLTIHRKEGIKSLFSGIVPTILRDGPSSGLYFLFYQKIRSNIQTSSYSSYSSTSINFVSGAISGVLVTLATHPADVVKTRVQLQRPLEGGALYYNGTLDAIKKIWRDEGIHGFYKGVTARALRKAGQAAVSWTLFEDIVKFVDRTSPARFN